MPAIFDDLMAEVGRPLLLEQCGQQVTYVETDVDDATLTAILGDERDDEEGDDDGRTLKRIRTATISTDPDAEEGGVAVPKIGAHIVIDGVSWTIDGVESQSGALARLRLARPRRSEVSRAEYRRE